MQRSSSPDRPPEAQSFPLFYIYRRMGHPVPLIPLDELPSWLNIGGRDWTDPWWLEDITPVDQGLGTVKKFTFPGLHKVESLPAGPSTALSPNRNQKDVFLRLLDPESEDEFLRRVHSYTPEINGSKLDGFQLKNSFMRAIMEKRGRGFKPKERLYDPSCPLQRFYLGHGRYPYLWGVFGEVIVFPDEFSWFCASAATVPDNHGTQSSTSCSITSSLRVCDGKELTFFESTGKLLPASVDDGGPNLPVGYSFGEVPLRRTISAPEYLTIGPMGGRPEGLSEGVSLAAGLEFLHRIMRDGEVVSFD